MKLLKYLTMFAFVLLLASNVMAQEQEMTEEEWRAEIQRLNADKQELTSELAALKTEVEDLRSELNNLQEPEDCYDELYAMVGATEADVDAFRRQVEALSAKINRRDPEKADRQAELDALKANKISALPEFYNTVHNELQRKLDAWVVKPTEVMYTVVKGDHLWGIAGKSQHYSNSFAWPKIYEANRATIGNNPDLIYPNQVFTIPNLTDAEKAKWDKIRMNYKAAPKQ